MLSDKSINQNVEPSNLLHSLAALDSTGGPDHHPSGCLTLCAWFSTVSSPNNLWYHTMPNGIWVFSNHEPTTQDIQTIRRIPVPPAKTVTDIVAACKVVITAGTCSVKCLHVPSTLGKMAKWYQCGSFYTGHHFKNNSNITDLQMCMRTSKNFFCTATDHFVENLQAETGMSKPRLEP